MSDVIMSEINTYRYMDEVMDEIRTTTLQQGMDHLLGILVHADNAVLMYWVTMK